MTNRLIHAILNVVATLLILFLIWSGYTEGAFIESFTAVTLFLVVMLISNITDIMNPMCRIIVVKEKIENDKTDS